MTLKFKLTPDYIFMGIILILAIWMNSHYLYNSNINYTLAGHDEYLTVREVFSILHPLSLKHFFLAIISGDVLYYGRIMFYTDALLSFIPYKIWGISGLVYSIRMVHVLMVISGLLILGNTFIKEWKHRLLFYIGTATLYYSVYFFMIPKPEPIQLLALAIFFNYFKRNNYGFGKYFIWIGIAYGIKFNIITLLPIVFLLPFFNNKNELKAQLKQLIGSIIYFLIGLIIAVPCLILGPIKPIFVKSYFNATFANTSQYDDDATLGIIDWLGQGWFGAYNGGWIFGIILSLFGAMVLFLGVKKLLKSNYFSNELILVLVGLAMILPVILFTNRLWPHYLWTGYIFLILGCLVFIESENISKALKLLSTSAFFVLLIGSLYCSFSQDQKLVGQFSQIQSMTENGKKAYDYIRQRKPAFTSVQDITVPYPFEEMLLINRFNPFTAYQAQEGNQRFMWSGFISPAILHSNKADYLLTNKLNFEDTSSDLRTEKDSTLQLNNQLMRAELGKTVIKDTAFGPIKIYRIISN